MVQRLVSIPRYAHATLENSVARRTAANPSNNNSRSHGIPALGDNVLVWVPLR